MKLSWALYTRIFACMLLLFATLKMPATFYDTMRVFVFLAAAATALDILMRERKAWHVCGLLVMAAVAGVFNPFFQVHMSRKEWFYVDFLTIGVFWAACALLPVIGSDDKES